jgi:hypothetical protein
MSVTAIILKGDRAGSGLKLAHRDYSLDGYNDGRHKKWVFDFARSDCYSQITPVVNGALVENLCVTEPEDFAGTAPNATMSIAAGQTVTWINGALDWSAVNSNVCRLVGPTTPAAEIAALDQNFLAWVHVTLPAQGDWTTAANTKPFIGQSTHNSGYSGAPEIFSLGQTVISGSKLISFVRQKSIGSIDQLTIAPNVLDYGSKVQLACWRNDTGQFLRLKSPNGSIMTSTSRNVNNTELIASLATSAGIFGLHSPVLATSQKWALHRGGVGALAGVEDPINFLDNEYAIYF